MAKNLKLVNPGKAAEPWMADAASLVVQEDCTLGEALSKLGVEGYSGTEIAAFSRRKAWKDLVRETRNAFFEELALDPIRTKETLIGQMVFCVSKLIEQEQYDKALEGGLKLAKLQGWLAEIALGPQTVLQITQEDIDKAKQLLSTTKDIYQSARTQ